MQNDVDPVGRLLAAISETDEETWRWVGRECGLPQDTPIPAVEDEEGDAVVVE